MIIDVADFVKPEKLNEIISIANQYPNQLILAIQQTKQTQINWKVNPKEFIQITLNTTANKFGVDPSKIINQKRDKEIIMEARRTWFFIMEQITQNLNRKL